MNEKEILEETIKKLKQEISDLTRKNEEYRSLAKDDPEKDVNRNYKDRLFKFIFGNAENKEWTLSLYNAVNGTDYTDPDNIVFNTIGDVIYMRMKNDVSFMVGYEMHMWEHQSTVNPNMPVRFFIYSGRLYEKYIIGSDYNQYSSTLQPVPRPVCVCFYNGTADQPEKQIYKLSDAYGGKGDIELTVTVLNINYGNNQKIMEACKPLKEYAWFVDTVRRLFEKIKILEIAVENAVEEMPEDFIIKPFLLQNRAEVKEMFLTEYDEEKTMRMERKEWLKKGRKEGMEEGMEEGMKEGRKERETEIAADMLREGASCIV